MPDALGTLADRIRVGIAPVLADQGVKPLLRTLFGELFQKRHLEESALRDAYALASDESDSGVPWAGLINPDNPPSGPYGGTSLVWFPGEEQSLIGLGVGTRGLMPDEGILTRPGHRRRVAALRKLLAARGVEVWTKADPAAFTVEVPKSVRARFPGFEKTFQRYGREMYCNALVPTDSGRAREVVGAFVNLYAYERGWQVLKAYEVEFQEFQAALRGDLFATPTSEDVDSLLRERRFVVLQGPPGTGKTRLADEVLRKHFGGAGMTVQFHPAVTYEDFVVGLSPNAESGELAVPGPAGLATPSGRASKDPALLTRHR